MQEPNLDNIMDNFLGYPEHKRAIAVKILLDDCDSADFSNPNFDDEYIRTLVCYYPDLKPVEKKLAYAKLYKLAVPGKAPKFLINFVTDPDVVKQLAES